jgi:ABC-type nitrate/sulfonate/bicarbonate transport system substrate-binding protein
MRRNRRSILIAATALAAMICTGLASQAQETKIRIGYPSGMNGQIPVTMEKAGIAAKHGLDATFTGFQNGPPMMEALVAGHLDAVVTSFLPPVTLSSKLPGLVTIVAALGSSSHSLLVPKDSKVSSIKELRGAKIGVSFSTESHLDLLTTLKAENIDPKSDLTLVNLSPNELPSSFENGLVDAVVIRQPQTLRLEDSLGARRIRTWPFYFLSIVRSDYLKQNPDAVKRYVEALKDAVFHIVANPDQAAVWFGENQRIDPAVVRRLATENPLFAAKSRDDIALDVTPAFRRLLEERLEAIQSFGFTRERVRSEALLP